MEGRGWVKVSDALERKPTPPPVVDFFLNKLMFLSLWKAEERLKRVKTMSYAAFHPPKTIFFYPAMKGEDMTPQQDLIQHLRDEEQTGAGNALSSRIEAIENLPDGPLRARLCADAFIRVGTQTMRLLEGDDSTARQLRRLADQIEAAAGITH